MTNTNTGSYDLTSSSGMAQAIDFLKNQDGYLLLALPVLGPVLGPIPYLAKKAIDYFGSGVPVAREQEEIAVNLLKKGRELGLSEIEITLEKDVGVDIAAKLPNDLNVDIKLKIGSNTKTIVRAKYRSA